MTNATQGRRPAGPGAYHYEDGVMAFDCLVTRHHDLRRLVALYVGPWNGKRVDRWGPVDDMPGSFTPLTPPVADVSQLSDGYHTFAELYEHRHTLFAALMYVYAPIAFKTRRNQSGEEWPGWFIAGMDTPMGQLSYHMPDEWWDRLPNIAEVERNSGYDGHTSADVLRRISWLREFYQHPDPNPWPKPPAAPEPDWSQAPEWAMWTTVDATGMRQWWGNEPPGHSTSQCMWMNGEYPGKYATGGRVDLPIGVDWRTTLRKRPETAE